MNEYLPDAIINGNCIEVMQDMPEDSVDLIVTSPPYADKRQTTYGGIPPDEYAAWLLDVSDEAMRVLKPTGSFIVNVKEGCEDGQRQRYVLEYQLEMAKNYRWVDTFIWHDDVSLAA